MKIMKKTTLTLLVVAFLLSGFVSSCTGADRETEIAVIVALTQTAAAQQGAQSIPPTEEPAANPLTEAPSATPTATVAPAPVLSGYQPYDLASCTALKDSVSASVGLSGALVSPAPFTDFITSLDGSACQVSYSATGATLPAGTDLYGSTASTFAAMGWTEDNNYGAGGPTGLATAFRKDSTLCLVAYERVPADRSQCSADEPISFCFDKLTPDQILYNLTLNCSTYFP